MGTDDLVSQQQSTRQWELHQTLHKILENSTTKEIEAVRDSLKAALFAHVREQELHAQAHEREHQMTATALDKAEQSMDKRLEQMTVFREELNAQAGSFVNREMFERYIKESEAKVDTSIAALTDKWDIIAKSLVNRHEADFNIQAQEIQNEREFRRAFEGSMNTWKWIASFLGASGVAGVILLFATNT